MTVVGEEVASAVGLQKVAFTVAADEALARSEGLLELTVDYSSFRDSYGADWAGQLQLVSFGECWLSPVKLGRCPNPVPVETFTNDVNAGVLVAVVDLQAIVAGPARHRISGC